MVSLKFETVKMMASELEEASCLPDLLGEHILQNQLEFHLGEEDEIYEAYGRRKTAYPYRQLNNYSRELKEMEIKTAVLENDNLKAVFLPEYGGRLWELWDKKAGKNLLYTNDVLRFSNLALRNAWFSGGVEWNIGIIGHTPFTALPLYVAELKNDNGLPVLRMYEFERVRKVYYQMDFWLEEKDTRLNCRMKIINENSEVVPMYWWSNIAVPEFENGRVIVPAKEAFTNYQNKVYKVELPKVNGVDVLDYKKIPYSVDYFFDIPEEKPKYIANVCPEGYGLLQTSTNRLRGRKLFSWGNTQGSNHWQEFLTQKAGRYLEIQAGLGKTQYGCIPMAPHTTWEWLEQYGPISLGYGIAGKSHEERQCMVEEVLQQENLIEEMQRKLNESRQMAKTKVEPFLKGSGYGSFYDNRRFSEHLVFENTDIALEKWNEFFKTGILHRPEAAEMPDDFLPDDPSAGSYIKVLEENNPENWYAQYQAGLGYFTSGIYDKAKECFEKSWQMEENAWSCHGLAVVFLILEQKEMATEWMKKGLERMRENRSYLKEGLKILHFCEAYSQICEIYEELPKEKRAIPKVKFYYLSALVKCGKMHIANELLLENGGLVVDDVREGEDSLGDLWRELQEKMETGQTKVPYIFDFKSNE